MGALILLLLVTTRRIRQQQIVGVAAAVETVEEDDLNTGMLTADTVEERQAVVTAAEAAAEEEAARARKRAEDAAAIAEARERVARLSEQLETLKTLSGQLIEQKRQREAELARTEGLIGRLRDQVAVSDNENEAVALAGQTEEVEKLQQQAEDLESKIAECELRLSETEARLTEDQQTTKQVESLLVRRESALNSLRELVREVESRPASDTVETVIEFSNSTGTTREPIVIDVSESGFTFLPSEVRITPEDLLGFPPLDNPLLSGIEALHRERTAESGRTSIPYVLLLVRPEGVKGFYAAQRTLNAANIHFGYELLEPDRVVATGEASGDEERVLRESLLAALQRRQKLYARLLPLGNGAVGQFGGDDASDEDRRDNRRLNQQFLPGAAEDGRFYAGGPPPRARAVDREPAVSTLNRAQIAERLAEISEAIAAQKQENEVFSDEQRSEVMPFDVGDDTSRAEAGLSEALAGETEFGRVNSDDSTLPAMAATEPTDAAATELTTDNWNRREPDEFWDNLRPLDDESAVEASRTERDNQLTRAQLPSDWPATSSPADDLQAARTVRAARAGNNGPGLEGQPGQAASLFEPSWNAETGHTSPSLAGPSAANSWQGALPPGVDRMPASELMGQPLNSQQVSVDELTEQLLKLNQRNRNLGATSRQEVTVFLDPGYMTIAEQTPIETDGLSTARMLAELLQGLHDELQYSPAGNVANAVPYVRFVVSPGAERQRAVLASRLDELGISSTPYVQLDPHVDINRGEARYSLPQRAEAASRPSSGMPVIRPREADEPRRIRL